jgi:hypothetical protein
MATTQEAQQSTQSTASTQAPEKHETPEPQQEHRWLHKLVGDWTYEGEAPMKPGQAPEKFSGTESVRKVGELWVIGEGRGPMPGGEEATSVLTLGYDPQKQTFVGTWIGSMMAQLWVYEGELDAGAGRLTLNTEGPSMQGDGTLAKYREVMELLDDDRRTFTSQFQGEDGSWQQMMTMTYRRKGGRAH